jgi:uncharacterized membrane protein
VSTRHDSAGPERRAQRDASRDQRPGYRCAVAPLARTVIALLALLVGAAIGTIATFAHAALPPWALLAGLAIVAAYVLGARLAFDERMPGVAAAVGVVAAVVLIAVAPVDAVVIDPEQSLAIVWLVAAPLVAAAAVLWPLPRRPEAASESP